MISQLISQPFVKIPPPTLQNKAENEQPKPNPQKHSKSSKLSSKHTSFGNKFFLHFRKNIIEIIEI